MKSLVIIGLILTIQCVQSIDLDRLKMYKQQDIEYNERQRKGVHRDDKDNSASNFQSESNLDDSDQNLSSNIQFPKVSYTYTDIANILNAKLGQYTEKSKVFEALQTYSEQEKEFQNALEKLKTKQSELRLETVTVQENIYLTIEDQEVKGDKIIKKLTSHLDNLKKQINLKTQYQTAIKERVFDLEGNCLFINFKFKIGFCLR